MSTRVRTQTAKGEAYNYDVCCKNFKRIESSIFKRMSLVENLIKSDQSDPSIVRSELNLLMICKTSSYIYMIRPRMLLLMITFCLNLMNGLRN